MVNTFIFEPIHITDKILQKILGSIENAKVFTEFRKDVDVSLIFQNQFQGFDFIFILDGTYTYSQLLSKLIPLIYLVLSDLETDMIRDLFCVPVRINMLVFNLYYVVRNMKKYGVNYRVQVKSLTDVFGM